MKQFLVRQIL